MLLKIADIVIDESLTPRDCVNLDIVRKYREALDMGATFPPIVLGKDVKSGRLVLIDGRHRLTAHQWASRDQIDIEITKLPRAKWFLESVTTNSSHGMPLSEQEKLRAAWKLKSQGFTAEEIEKAVATAMGLIKERWKDKPDKSASPRSHKEAPKNTEFIINMLQRTIRALKNDEIPKHESVTVQKLLLQGAAWIKRNE